jgi:hypothetical protein
MRGIGRRSALALFLFMSVALFTTWWVRTHSQDSIERTSSTVFVARLYQQVLGRAPETGDVAGWARRIHVDGSVVPTVLAFFHSPEFLSRHISDQQFLTLLYLALLKREPDPAGVNAFLRSLQAGQLTRDNLFDIFLGSKEFATVAGFLPPRDPVTAFTMTL